MISGVILAGGASSRMGMDKALMPVAGVPRIQHIANTMRTVFAAVHIVSDRFEQYAFLQLPGLRDVHPGCGPLGGIHAALTTLDTPAIFVTGCDTPFVSKELITYIVRQSAGTSACIVQERERIHPLCGVYMRTCLPEVKARIASGRLKMLQFLEEVGACIIPLDTRLSWYHEGLLTNINTPDDLPPLTPPLAIDH